MTRKTNNNGQKDRSGNNNRLSFLSFLSLRKAATIFIISIVFHQASSQNYSSADTVTEYPNKGTFYHDKFEGRKTASGEVFNQNAFTAAHWRIKLGTYILVTNRNTGLQVIVKVNDRCPRKGVIDLSRRAAYAIGIRGCQPVTVRILPDGYEERCLAQDAMFDSVQSRMRQAAPATVRDATPAIDVAPTIEPTPDREPVHHSEQLYNLILCNVTSHGEAYGNIQKLPAKYQEKAMVETVSDSNDLRVSLDVRLNKKQIAELQRTLAAHFPKTEIIPIP